MSITEIAIKRPTLVVVIFTVLAILGVTSYSLLNYDLIPKMSNQTLSIATQYPGASATEVETTVTKEIEEALSSMESVKSMQSTSQEGMSIITLEMESNADENIAIQNAQRLVNARLSKLPTGAKTPSINKFSTEDMPILKLGVTGDLSPEALYQITNDEIKPQLSRINGVGQISFVGDIEREIKVKVSKKKLDAYNISITQIYNAIYNANMEMPTGKIEGTHSQYTVRLLGKVKSLDDLRNISVLTTQAGSQIKLSDLADVIDATSEQQNINRINGQNSIGVIILKQTDANTVDVSKKVKEQLAKIESQFKDKKIKFDVASDNSTYTLASANAVMEDLMFAVLLVAIVMFLFLHSVRNSFIVLVSIPTSIISVFIAMYVFDFSLNMLTLMALSLIIGILVDDSIVVLENIFRHMEQGKNRKQAALDGRNEIGFTAVAITMVDVVVFLPLSLVSGMIGGMLREFSLVIVFSTLMSLIVSFTVTPLLASRFTKIEKLTGKTWINRFALWFEGFLKNLTNFYEKALRWALNHRKTVFISITILIVSSFSLVGFGLIGAAFMNDGDQGEFIVKLEGNPQNTLAETSLLTQKVEDLITKHPEVVKVFSNVGYSSTDFGSGSNAQYISEITVNLVNKRERKISVIEFAAMIKKEAQGIPGLKVTSTASNMMGSADDAPIQVLLRGPNVEKLYAIADSVVKVVKTIPGTNDVKLSIDKSKPEIHISLNREKMEQLGLSVLQVGSNLNLALAGNTDIKFAEGDKDYDINVQFDKFDRNNIDEVKTIAFINSQGKRIELSSFAEVFQSVGPNKLERYDRIPSITVNSSVFGRPVGTVGDEIKQAIKNDVNLGSITVDYKGQMERQADAFGSLFLAIAAALIFVYLVMVALYNSYLYPFVVMFSIPAALIGALLALALSGESLTVFSMIGMIMLIGLVAKNAILLVDFANKLRENGMSVLDSLIESGRERLRPILMTTLSMVFGMLPIALATGASAESKNGLAWVIIGGLTSSLILTLILVPAVYMSMENMKVKLNKRFPKKQE
ncbi:MAG: efflux RND transporter permease subunit [Paludibacter sp.]|nr:efflux RND transporter permease subunit [Paludibacter sp.]